MTRRSLITGVTGQDGWYLSRLLLSHGHDVFGLIRPGDDGEVVPGVQVLTGDLLDSADVATAIVDSDPDEIYNLGGISSVGYSWSEPVETADVTGMGLLRLVAAVRARTDAGDRAVRIVQASSAEIFGAEPPPHDETTRLAPQSPYGAAKAFAHHIAAVYRGAGLPVSTAILYNHESPRRPDSFVTRRITSQVAQIACGRAETLRIGSLDSRRDWGFAGDYARAMYLIAQHPDPDDFVIASGVSRTVGDFVTAAFAHVGVTDWRSRVELDPAFARPVDTAEQRGNPAKAERVLGWRPETSFEQMVADMVDADLALFEAPPRS